jgi:DNA-binding response OmpR family regulator
VEFGEDGCDRETLGAKLGIHDSSLTRNLDAAIFRLRKKVENSAQRAAPIRTIHGVGYSVVGTIRIK